MNPANGIPYPTHRNSDALEAYDSFRRSRCLFFCLLLAGLVITQGSFWIVTLGNLDPAVSPAPAEATAEGTPPASPESRETLRAESLAVVLETVITLCNYVMSFSAVLYCLSLLIAMKLSLVSRLGGLAPASKAFFLSLIVMVLVLPWQSLICPSLAGTLFAYPELVQRYSAQLHSEHFMDTIYYYGRFTGLWVVTLSVLIAAQLRSRQATRLIYPQRIAPNETQPLTPLFPAAELGEKENLIR